MGIFLVRGRVIGLFLDWVECCSWLNESMVGGVLEHACNETRRFE